MSTGRDKCSFTRVAITIATNVHQASASTERPLRPRSATESQKAEDTSRRANLNKCEGCTPTEHADLGPIWYFLHSGHVKSSELLRHWSERPNGSEILISVSNTIMRS